MRRIYRRICLLRATGRDEEASALEHSDFREVLAAARMAPEAAQKETAILNEESERVASASALAEVLAPMLAARLQLHAAPAPVVTPVAAPQSQSDTAFSPPPRRARAATRDSSETAASGVPGIADLIDGMLSQEATPLPSRRGA